MSNQYYNTVWQETINDMQDLIQVENFQTESDFLKRPPTDLYQFYAQSYLRYINIYKKLEDCYDQIVHPQKRINLKEMLELVIIRMIENKKSLIFYNTHSNNYQADMINLDELITDQKLTPDALEVPIPRYFRKETDKERLDERNQIIDKLLMEFFDTDQPEEVVYVDQIFRETKTEDMVKIIQTIERGRQGIQRGLLSKQQKKDRLKKEAKSRKIAEGEEVTAEQESESALLIIEKYWRGYRGREQVFMMRQDEMKFLGIQKDSEDPKDPNSQYMKSLEQRQKMTIIQQQNQKEYEQAKVNLKQLVKEAEGPEIKEKKIKERIDWIDMYLDKTQGQKLPGRAIDYYDQKKRLPPTQEELDALKGGKKGAKKEQKSEKKGKKGKKDKKEEKKDSINLDTVVKINSEVDQFLTTWGSINDAENFAQTYVTEIAKGLMRTEVDSEMNGLVDELIEIELDNRNLFLFKKPRKRPPKPKPPKPPKPPKFKVPGAGGQRGRNPLDMLSELVDAGIIKKLLPATLTDLRGGQNVLGTIQEQQFKTAPDPSYAQLRTGLAEFVAMQLGSPVLKEKLDRQVYFLFFGPRGSGKTLAIRALAYECNAMLIDLTPSNIATRCTDKASIGKTFYMAFTVAKHFHPSIIFMDEIEQVFGPAKKRKGVAAAQWAKLKKPLQDFKKQKFIEAASRVVFIGCSDAPLTMTMKDTKNYFDRKFYFPPPNYDTRLQLLSFFFAEKKVTLDPNFPLSTLAHVTENYTAGTFKQILDQVLTNERIKKLSEDPLKINEFLTPLSKSTNCEKQSALLSQFYDEVSGIKDRREKAKAPAADPKKGGKRK